MKRLLFGILAFSITLSAQTAPLALYQDDPELAKHYEEALQNHPERLGGKLGDSPVFVGGQLYGYAHCVKLANWVIDNLGVVSNMPVIQLGNLQYALDDSCNAAYDFYKCPESRLPASKIPVSPKQHAVDCANVGAAITVATQEYHHRLDQVFAALTVTQREQIEVLLSKSARELPPHAYALWLPTEFKPRSKEQGPISLPDNNRGWFIESYDNGVITVQHVGNRYKATCDISRSFNNTESLTDTNNVHTFQTCDLVIGFVGRNVQPFEGKQKDANGWTTNMWSVGSTLALRSWRDEHTPWRQEDFIITSVTKNAKGE